MLCDFSVLTNTHSEALKGGEERLQSMSCPKEKTEENCLYMDYAVAPDWVIDCFNGVKGAGRENSQVSVKISLCYLLHWFLMFVSCVH